MSELSPEDKRRLLRERRHAKMSQGKATERLNNILTKGSSVNSTAVKSVLEKLDSALPFETSHPSMVHEDPEVPDISLLLQTGKTRPGPEESDMDALMQKIFAGAGGGEGEPQNAEESTSKFFAETMKTMTQDPSGIPETPENASYQTKLAAHQEYQQKSWMARFVMIRFLVHTLNFYYHTLNSAGFTASSNVFVRRIRPVQGAGSFMTFFISAEIAVISSYFMILSANGVLRLSPRKHPASKLLSLASAVFPQASAYQTLLDSALVYWSGGSIILGDLMLIVVLFGLSSIFS